MQLTCEIVAQLPGRVFRRSRTLAHIVGGELDLDESDNRTNSSQTNLSSSKKSARCCASVPESVQAHAAKRQMHGEAR
jgi:hypothetical protein